MGVIPPGGEVSRYLGQYGSARVAKAVLMGAILPLMLKCRSNPGAADPMVLSSCLALRCAARILCVIGRTTGRPICTSHFLPIFYRPAKAENTRTLTKNGKTIGWRGARSDPFMLASLRVGFSGR